ncbi:MAG: hypothetical protein AAGJ50_10500, partial [Pseudomonadota bacterium]
MSSSSGPSRIAMPRLVGMKERVKRLSNSIKQVINARHAFGQYIPLQTLNRTLFEYDVTFCSGSEEECTGRTH